jgi:hypothetical protein
MEDLTPLIQRLTLMHKMPERADLLMPVPAACGVVDKGVLLGGLKSGIDYRPGGYESLSGATPRVARIPAGIRMSRLAFGGDVQALVAVRDADVPAGLFHLPDEKQALIGFLAERAGLWNGDGDPGSENIEASLERFYGFRLGDVAEGLLEIGREDRVAYVLLLSLEFNLALAKRPTLGARSARFPRLRRGLLDAVLMLAELERLRSIVGSLAARLYGARRDDEVGIPLSSAEAVRMLSGREESCDAFDDRFVAYLGDAQFHVETLLWHADAGPRTIDPQDPLLKLLMDDSDVRVSMRHPEARARLLNRLKEARSSRPNRGGKTMPIGLARFMGLDILDTATVGLVEIGHGVDRLSNKRVTGSQQLARKTAFWTLFLKLLGNVATDLSDRALASGRRGPMPPFGEDAKDREFGEARMRRAQGRNGLIHVYLPVAATPVGAGRFVPDHWLNRDRHLPFWRGIVQDFQGGGLGGAFDALPAEWKPALLARITALRETLHAIRDRVSDAENVDVTASAVSALFTGLTPLTSDPLLAYVLQRHRKARKGDWLPGIIAASQSIHDESEIAAAVKASQDKTTK